MIDRKTWSIVQEVIRRESRSFMQYLGDSLPWPTREGAEVDAKLRPFIDAERQRIAELCQLLNRNHIPLPYTGSFPAAFTTANFSSFTFLVNPLIEEERKLIATLEEDVASVPASDGRDSLSKMLEAKRNHLQELEFISSSPLTRAGAAT